MPEDLAVENARLRRENHQLRDTNELLKAASAFRVGTRSKTSEMIRFIDEYRNRFSVEFICKALKNNRAGGFITSRGYRQSKARGLSARRLRDVRLPSSSGHPICTDLVSVGEDVHCESTAQEVHAGVPA